MDHYSLERIRQFFNTLQPVLKVLYLVVDKLDKKKGRKATDRRYQFRFVLWWKFFAPVPVQTAVERVNSSPELKQILGAPEKPYTRYSLRRFLQDLGEEGFLKMILLTVVILGKKGIINASKVVMDSFPVYSFLNSAKSLRMPKFDKKFAKQFFDTFSWQTITDLFPEQHWKAAPLVDKLKAYVHQYLWDVPSAAKNHALIFGKEKRRAVMGLQSGWKSSQTYRNFLSYVIRLPNFGEIEQVILAEVKRVLAQLDALPARLKLGQLDDLRGVFHSSYRLKDHGASLGYCSAKDQTFFGRGGLLAILASHELPLLARLTAKYKQSEKGILAFLKDLRHYFNDLLTGATFYGDGEFGTASFKQAVQDLFKGIAVVDHYGNSTKKTPLTSDQKRVRITVERVIGRLKILFHIENPPFLGNALVATHTQLCCACDLLLVTYNVLTGNRTHPHAYKAIMR